MSNQIVISSGAKLRNLNGVITGTTGVLDSVPLGGANGVATLDSSGKVPVSQLPSSVVTYLGTWNAATNTPTLANGTGDAGDMYICNVAGTVNFGAGPITFAVGDWVLYGSGTWQKSNGQNGTVTSVAVTESGDALTITGSPITTAGTINIGFAGTSAQYVAGNGSLITFPTLISSIGLTMPSAFSVANSPLTANGTIAVTGAGYASQYIRGDGTLADFPSGGGGGSSVSYYLNGGTSQGTIGGTTYYQMSKTADTGTGVDFTKSGDGLIVSFLTNANDPAQLNIPGGNWNFEIYASMSSNGGTPELYAELYKYDGTTFTLISTSSNEILYDGTNLNLYTFAMAVPSTTLTLTDRLAVKLYATNSGGKSTTVHTQNGHLCQIITTFSTGITALNGLTAQVQYFGTGTSGTDFNISSASATHTFNLPTASATNRGALSSADWTTFNNKLSTATAASTYVPYTGATGLVNLGTYNLKANSLYAEGDGAFAGGGLLIKQYASGVSSITGYNTISSQTSGFYFSASQGGSYKNFLIDPSGLTNVTTRTYTLPNASGTLALTSNLSSYVPYSGATTDVLLGSWALFSAGVQVTNGGLGVISTDGLLSASKGIFLTDTASGGNWATGTTNIVARTSGLLITHNLGGGILNFNTSTTYTYNFPAADGTLALTSNLSSYLPLSGGTLTGALNGTSAVFSSSVTAAGLNSTIAKSGSGVESISLLNLRATGTGAIGDSQNIRFLNTDGIHIANIAGILGGDNIAYGSIAFSVRNYNTDAMNEAMRINNRGNVGIGTTSPGNFSGVGFTGPFLDIAGVFQVKGTSANGLAAFQLGGDTYRKALIYTPVGTDTPYLAFGVATSGSSSSANEAMRITSGGNVLIGGTTGAAVRLGAFSVNNTSSCYSFVAWNASGADMLSVRGDGLISSGTGTLSPYNFTTGTGANMVVDSSGYLYRSTSSLKYKTNVIDYDKGLDIINKIRPVYYNSKNNGDTLFAGLIAEDIHDLGLTEFVQYAEDGTPDALSYSNMVALLIKGMQEQQQQIEELKAKIK